MYVGTIEIMHVRKYDYKTNICNERIINHMRSKNNNAYAEKAEMIGDDMSENNDKTVELTWLGQMGLLIKIKDKLFYTKDKTIIGYIKGYSAKIKEIENNNRLLIFGGRPDVAFVCAKFLDEIRDEIIDLLNEDENVIPFPIVIND